MANDLTEKEIQNEMSIYQRLARRFQKEQSKIQENNEQIASRLGPGEVVFVPPQVQQAQLSNVAQQAQPLSDAESYSNWHAKNVAETIAENQAKVQALEHILSIINVLDGKKDARVIRRLAEAAQSIRIESPMPKHDLYAGAANIMGAQQAMSGPGGFGGLGANGYGR